MHAKRIALAVGAGLVAAGAIGASAASLGGISGASAGADDTVVASCDTDGITTAYTTAYNAGLGAYRVTGVNLTGVNAACDTLAYKLTLADNANASLTEATGTLTVTGGAASITVTPVSAESVERLALVISG